MSSPIHSYLFSPPGSPALRASPIANSPIINSVVQLLPDTLLPHRGSVEGLGFGNELKIRSPRTPQTQFSTSQALPSYPAPTATATGAGTRQIPKLTVEDVERSPHVLRTPLLDSAPMTPRWRSEKVRLDPEYAAANVPSAPMPVSFHAGLPRPLLRLLFFGSLVISSIMLLIMVPGARLPSLREATVGRRLALDNNSQATWDVMHKVDSFEEAVDRDYIPPQIRAPHMMKRSYEALVGEPTVDLHYIPNPKTTVPSYNHPVPATHELLALQSYVLQSSYNVLPASTDPSEPLDATVVSGLGRGRLGPIGSLREKAWLEELETEAEKEISIWFGLDGNQMHPHRVLSVLEGIHGNNRRPSLIPCHSRSDREILQSLLGRLQGTAKVTAPVMVVGGKAIVATDETLDAMATSGELKELMGKIGWVKREVKAWKPKLAKVKRRELSEVEQALKRENA